MTAPASALDEAPVRAIHKRTVAVAMGGPFCDGYLLGIIALALPQITSQLELSGTETGLVAASALLGVFVGGLLFGPLTDRVGRRVMFVLNLVVFVVASVAQIWVDEGWQLIGLRLVLGIAIGADYPIASALTAELVPRKLRGPALSGLVLGWWVGYAAAYVIGWALRDGGSEAWRWMLVSAAVPAAVFLLLRTGLPESPFWLASKGRIDEAQKIFVKYFGREASAEEVAAQIDSKYIKRGTGLGNLIAIFRRGYGIQLLFCSVFWICQVAPAYSLRTFQPQMLNELGIGDTYSASTFITILAVVGVVAGMALINRVGRRGLLVSAFICGTFALTAVALVPHSFALVIVALFVLYQCSEAAGSGLQFVYPSELFPTDLRATGSGFATAMSRLGATASTFVLPMTTEALGMTATLLLGAGITAVGLVVTVWLAPETKSLSLAEASLRSGPQIRR
ncbi:MFS transporter [Streptomyces sp. NPDC048565]|uniref:MFS transporter n=1 Tax=Streptomyces sp. NPDC048565 TaxID=3155266 RepID=UPI00341ACAD0